MHQTKTNQESQNNKIDKLCKDAICTETKLLKKTTRIFNVNFIYQIKANDF